MVKKVLIITCLALTLLSCSLLDTINGKDEPQVIVVTATPEKVLPTEAQIAEPTVIRESITITDPVPATLTELAGPFKDSLIRNENSFVPEYCAGVNLKNFKAEVTFTSLPVFNTRQNSFAFFFRQQTDNNQYRLNVYEDGWQLRNRKDDYNVIVNTGQLMMTWGEKNENTLTLYAVDDTGYFYLNGYYIFQLNLKDHQESGDVCVVSSVFDSDLYGVVTEFKDFKVWELTQP